MQSLSSSMILALVISFIASGCQQTDELKTIDMFNSAVNEKQPISVRLQSSPYFKKKALRSPGAMEDLALLRIPHGKATVVATQDVSEFEKRVQVEVGERKQKLTYRLVRDSELDDWRVDDIIMKKSQQGLVAKRSVTEQMDLLLSIREFLTAWHSGDVKRIRGSSTPELSQLLSELPEAHLSQLAKRIVGPKAIEDRHRPEASLDKSNAVVSLRRKQGVMMLTMKLLEDGWKVDDMAVEFKQDQNHIASLKKSVVVMATGLKFLEHYQQQDKTKLKDVTTEKLFRNAIAKSTLPEFPLPNHEKVVDKMMVKSFPHHAEIMIPLPQEIVKLNIIPRDSEEDPTLPTRYFVEDVTVYELNSSQEKQLSSYFTSHALLRLFAASMQKGDLKMLEQLSTPDLSHRVWQRLGKNELSKLDSMGVPFQMPKILKTEYQGSLTHVTTEHEGRTITFVLKNWNQLLSVDDIEIPDTKHPLSLKQTIDVMHPVEQFVQSLDRADLDKLQSISSTDFNRVVWSQTETVPPLEENRRDLIRQPLTTIQYINPDQALVTYGSSLKGSRFLLKKERDRFLIDDVLLIGGVEPMQQAQMKKVMREQIVLREGAIRHRMPLYAANGSDPTGYSGKGISLQKVTPQTNLNPHVSFAGIQQVGHSQYGNPKSGSMTTLNQTPAASGNSTGDYSNTNSITKYPNQTSYPLPPGQTEQPSEESERGAPLSYQPASANPLPLNSERVGASATPTDPEPARGSQMGTQSSPGPVSAFPSLDLP